MQFLPMYAQMNVKEKNEKENFCSQLSMEKIEEQEFLKEVMFKNKIVVYKNEVFVGNGFAGKVEQVHIFTKENETVFKTASLKLDNEGAIQEIPEFEYLVFLENEVYIILKNSTEELEIYRFGDTVEIYAMILATSTESQNTIVACCLYDKSEDIIIRNVTTDEQTVRALYILFNSWTGRE